MGAPNEAISVLGKRKTTEKSAQGTENQSLNTAIVE
jgi:hypothetical protein